MESSWEYWKLKVEQVENEILTLLGNDGCQKEIHKNAHDSAT